MPRLGRGMTVRRGGGGESVFSNMGLWSTGSHGQAGRWHLWCGSGSRLIALL